MNAQPAPEDARTARLREQVTELKRRHPGIGPSDVNHDVLYELDRLRNQQRARELFAAEQAADAPDWAVETLDGDDDGEELQPAILPRTDGLCLFYAGMTHWVSGESGKGKSWLVQAAAAHVAQDLGRVLYLDYEDSAKRVRHRLRQLGCTEEDRRRVTYVRAQGAPGDAFAALLLEQFDLVVIDGVTRALNAHGLAGESPSNNNDAVSRWYDEMPGRLATETGAAVVCVDHVNKSREHGGFAGGAHAKRDVVTGAAYMVAGVDPFGYDPAAGRGRSGSFDVTLVKDKQGAVEGALDGSLFSHVRVAVDDDGAVRLDLTVPPGRAEMQANRAEGIKHAVWGWVKDNPGASGAAVKRGLKQAGVRARAEAVDTARAELLADGYLRDDGDGNRAKLHAAAPYTPEFVEEELA